MADECFCGEDLPILASWHVSAQTSRPLRGAIPRSISCSNQCFIVQTYIPQTADLVENVVICLVSYCFRAGGHGGAVLVGGGAWCVGTECLRRPELDAHGLYLYIPDHAHVSSDVCGT